MSILSAVVGSSVFLQGNRLSVGIGATGSFGTAVSAPSGFFTDTAHGFTNLGLYADLDGFGRGALPTFRDAIVPGTPEERFNVGYRLSAGASPVVLTNSDLVRGAGTALPASAVENLSTGTTLAARWTGQDGNGLQVSQVVSFDAANTYLKITVTLTNTSAQALHDVRYMRSVDPDQAPGFTTANYIFQQNPGGVLAAAYVPGSGTSGPVEGTSPFFYYSRDPRAVVANFGFTNTDPYAPAVTSAIQPEGTTSTTDSALAIAFDVGTLAAAASTSVTFYLGVAADLDEVIGSIVPEIETLTLDVVPDGAVYRDTSFEDTFAPLDGLLTSNGSDPIYAISGGVSSPVLPGFDQRIVGTYGVLYLNGSTGAYTYRPSDVAVEGLQTRARETFEVGVTEGEDTATGEITIALVGVNDRPTLAVSPPGARFVDTREDDTFAPLIGQLTGSDRDAGDSFTFGLAGGRATGVAGEVSKVGVYGTLILDTRTGIYIFEVNDTAIQGLSGTAREVFTFTVTDEGGLTKSESFTISITGTNDIPEATATLAEVTYVDTGADDAFAWAHGRLLGADRDMGQTLGFGVAGGVASAARPAFDTAKAGAFGTLYLNSGTGAYVFVPSDGIEGLTGDARETFTLLLRDGNGATASETFTVNLSGANDRPEGEGDTYATLQDRPLTVLARSGVLDNDTDRDEGDLSAVLVAGPRHGTLSLSPDGSFTYTPDAGYFGSDSFTYRPSDGALSGELTTVSIAVAPDGEPDNRPPVAADDARVVAEDETSLAAQVVTGGVLSNDRDPDPGDALHVIALNGEALGIRLIVEGRYGTLTLRADGSYAYVFNNTNTLIAGESAVERFTYTVADEAGRTSTARLAFTVDGSDLRLVERGTFIAHRGNDQITGVNGADRLAGREGNDTLAGEGGNDGLWGEAGDDAIEGGSGDDQGIGGSGDDVITLGAGNDRGWGEAGNDVLSGGIGNDRLDGGSGNDAIDLGLGDDRGWGSIGTDAIVGGAGADWLSGGADGDDLNGGSGDDELWGGEGNDRLDGGFGADRFIAGSGNDLLVMGSSNDTVWGGLGADRFLFEAGFGRDLIKDFGAGDRIVFDGVFATFAAVERAMRQDGANVVITGPGGQTITVENVASLTAGDFTFL